MGKRYQIWDRETPVITPTMEYFTPEAWMERYPAARVPGLTVVVGAGEINGSFMGTLGGMVSHFAALGADFSGAETDEEKLEVIEAFEDAMAAGNGESTPEERIAAALEIANVRNMPTVNEDDPDE